MDFNGRDPNPTTVVAWAAGGFFPTRTALPSPLPVTGVGRDEDGCMPRHVGFSNSGADIPSHPYGCGGLGGRDGAK